MAQHLRERLIRYKNKLERADDKEEKLNIIRKLDSVPMTVQLLRETGIGKLINHLGKEDGRIGAKAAIVLKKWKDIAKNENEAEGTAAKSAVKHAKNSADHAVHDQLLHSKPKYTNGHSVSRTSSSEQPIKKIKSESSTYKKHSSHLSNGSVLDDDKSSIKYCSFEDALCGTGSTEPYNPERPEICLSSVYKSVPEVEYKPTPISAINGVKIKVEKPDDKHHQVKTHSTKHHQTVTPSTKHHQTVTHSEKHHQAETHSDKHRKHGEKRKRDESQNHDSHTESYNHIKTEPHHHVKTESQNHVSKTKSSSSSKSEATKHSSEQKSKHSSGSTQKPHKSTSSHQTPNKGHSSSEQKKSEKSHKSSQKSSASKKMKVSNSEEFTASAGMNFEDILGFNDIVKPKKKKTNTNKPSKVSAVPALQVSSEEEKEEKPKSVKVEEGHLSKKKKSHSSKEASDSSSSSSKHSKNSKKDIMPDDLKEMPQLDELKTIDITSTLPEIQPNYKPLPQIDYDKLNQKKKNLSNEEAIMYTSSKKDRTAVYSGRRNFYMTEVPSLFEICTRVLIENLDCLEYFGGVPYFIMKPVLERCTPQQLYRLEDYNPDLAQETNELWERHCQRDFRSRKPEEGETWRELYLRVFDENEKKLKRLTANISAKSSQSNPVRQVKLAYVDSVVKPPRDVARRQAKHGTAQPVNHTLKGGSSPSKVSPRPAAAAAAAAPQGATPVPPPTPPKVIASTTLKKPKKAPLMAKTLKALKNLHRR